MAWLGIVARAGSVSDGCRSRRSRFRLVKLTIENWTLRISVFRHQVGCKVDLNLFAPIEPTQRLFS